ncbi:MAG: DUF488 family protein [Bryobacteraceae bacterium]|nr:DUF488 family protein [Bryobacterales bacterium]NUN00869.1 DUF488 family protein [Bryobacteraceae bacterium]
MIYLHRVYDHETAPKGEQYLVERLWPRGIRKEQLHVKEWLKEVAPSTGLRKWFSHDPAKWDAFKERYFAELDQHPDAWAPLEHAARKGAVVFLYSSKDSEHNNAVALKAYIESKLKRTR